MFVCRVPLLAMALAILFVGCEKPSHDNVEKWRNTEQGPDKLKAALANDSLDADLSAHAAAVLVAIGKDPDVRTTLDAMVSPRLWDLARIEKDLSLPSPRQTQAKDALVTIRKYADDATRKQIDTYLIDWYCVVSYDDARGGGRATAGAYMGATVMRLVGAPAAKRLTEVANGVIVTRIGDELMLSLAATCTPETVKYVLEISKLKRGDDTLQTRAMTALFKAYVDSGGLFDRCDHAPLGPNLDTIVAIAKDESSSHAVANDAVDLIRAAGPPACLPPLVSMIAHPHSDPQFKYVGAENALSCGGVAAIKEVVRALPDTAYDKEELVGAVAGVIAKQTPRDQALAAVRELLNDPGRVPRWVAIEALAAMRSTDDVPRLLAVKANDRLVGFWGDQSGVDPKSRKPEPTLAQRAKELAEQLQKPAK
jgi:HEAT repeat protein